MILGNGQSLLKFQWCFYHGSNQTLVYVPFDVAVEKPDTWVVGLESQDDVSIWSQDESISSHRNCGIIGLAGVRCIEVTGFFVGSRDGLEIVAVKMEWMLSGI